MYLEWQFVYLYSLHKINYSLVLFFCYDFYKIFRRYLISYKSCVVLTEEDLFD